MKKLLFILLLLIIGCSNENDSDMGVKRILGDPDYYPVTWDEYPGSAPTVVLMGDSRIDFMDVQKYFPGQHVINIALGGTTSENTLNRVPYIQQFNPDKVFISVGVNDVAHGISNGYKERIASIIEAVKNTCPSATIYVTKAIPSLCSNNPPLLDVIKGMNMGIESAITTAGATYINTDGMEDAGGGLKSEYAIDTLHYNEAGYDKFASLICPFLL